jgi:glycosyltransferase involved in cell wall biosynthesis
MRVLHIVESFAGGVFTSVTQLCNLQSKDGYEVYLAHSVRPGTPADYKCFLMPEITVIKLNLAREINPWRDLSGLFQIRRLINGISPDIIHLHSSKAGFLGRLAIFLGVGKGSKIFYSPRGFSFLQENYSEFKRLIYFFLEKLGASFGGTIVACSQGELLEAQKLKARNVVLLENAVDTDIVPVHSSENISQDTVTIGTLGRICPQKNPGLFKDLALAFACRKNLQFLWVGGGEGERELCKIPKLRVTGWLSRQDALERLQCLDIYVQTSLWEGMPISVIEAQVAGIPAVVTNVVGNRDIVIPGETGYIAENLSAMVYYIDLLSRERTLRVRMGECARRLSLERFSLERLQREVNQLYQKPLTSAGIRL